MYPNSVRIPSAKTLEKYGIDSEYFLSMGGTQEWCCACCKVPFGAKQIFIDHEHVRGFKKMPPGEKRRYVRGLLDYSCNRFRVCKNTLDSAIQVTEYLLKHERRAHG